jgi:hypothetical protein
MLRGRLISSLTGWGLVSMFCAGVSAQPVIFPEPLSPRIANYDINVRLDTEKRMLYGNETLTWLNKSGDAITELQFHLYLNAFRNSKSTFMKESGGVSRGNKIDKDGWGFIEVNRITLSSGEDLTGGMEFIHPDDDNAEDKTVFRLPLPKPLPPGGSIVLNIDFTAKLPQPPFARTGAKKEYFFAGQWFPKIGVYSDFPFESSKENRNGKWNCHQFHANSEFFADYGVYNVRMTVPEKNIVGATGLEVEVVKHGDGTATHFYHAEDIHDFAWTTSPEFVELTGKAQDVDIRVLMQPDRAYQGPRHLDAAKAAVEYFQNWYGDYPFPNLTVVDPRRGAGGSGGMEYPTLITAGTTYGLPEGIRPVELVIIHEFGHNFWYHLLASNEFEESWMDEGINTYTEIQIMNDRYGPVGDAIDFMGIKINDLQFQRGQYIFFPDLDPIVRKAWEFYNGTSYGVNSYSKPGVVLTTLQNYLGKETMQKVMRAYVERWRFKHPKTRDFINVANEASGRDLNWFFDQTLFSNAVLDYSVDQVFTREIRKDEGYDFTLSVASKDSTMTNGSPDTTAQATSDGKTKESPSGDSVEAKGKTKMYESGVDARRLGTFKFPVEVLVTFENGEKIRETWDGQELWKKFRYTKPTKLVSATVDPDRQIPLDINFTNNSKMVKKQRLGVNKLAIRWLFWMQFLLDQPEFMNLFSSLGISF